MNRQPWKWEAFVAEVRFMTIQEFAYAISHESGASVYSASELARHEFLLELTAENASAISIARRLQDPSRIGEKSMPNPSVSVNTNNDVNQKLTESLISLGYCRHR